MKILRVLSVLFALVTTQPVGFAQESDVAGSADHPLVSRFPGAVIAYYEQQDFGRYEIAIGDETGYRTISDWVTMEGKVSRIYYSVKGSKSIIEVFRNYKNNLEKAGFTFLSEKLHTDRNTSTKVGGRSWMVAFYESNPFPTNKGIKIVQGSPTSMGSGYMAAVLNQPTGKLAVSIGFAQYKEDEVVIMLDVIDDKKDKVDQLTADASFMIKEIQSKGKVALYITFDINSFKIKPEGAEVIKEIGQLLKNHPALQLFIVGHTDMQGSAEYNLTLSQQRAEQVMNSLVTNHGISKGRLEARGVGFFAPISSNDTEQGRTLNRRVELVKK